MSPRLATFTGFGAVLLWSQLAVLTVATGTVPPFQLTAMTFAVSGALGLGILAARREVRSALHHPWPVWALGTAGLFGYHALYFAALKLAPPAEAGLVNYLWPLLIVLLSGLLPGERLRALQILGALVGFAGVAVLVLAQGSLAARAQDVPGYLCAFAAAFVWAGYSVLSRRFKEVPSGAVAGFCTATALLSLVAHLAFERAAVPPGWGGWLAILALGLGPVGVAFFCWDIGMKRGDIRLLGVASYAAPVLSTATLVLAGYSAATPALAISCAMIVAGALLASFGRSRVSA